MCAFPHRKSKPFTASSFYTQEQIPTSDCPGAHFPLQKPIIERPDEIFPCLAYLKDVFRYCLAKVSRWLAAWLPGCWSCPLPAAGRSPEIFASRSLSAVPGLAPVGPVSSQSFPSYCFPGSLQLQQLFTSLGLPFLGEVCPSHQLPSPSPQLFKY